MRQTTLKKLECSCKWQSVCTETLALNTQVISPFFTNFIMFLIVTNAVLLGVEIDVSAKVGQDDIPTWFGTLNSCLVFVFVSDTWRGPFARFALLLPHEDSKLNIHSPKVKCSVFGVDGA